MKKGKNRKKKDSQDEIVNDLKGTGYLLQNSEGYGGLSNSWGFGPWGALIKIYIRDLWGEYFVTKSPNIVPLGSSIICNPSVWTAAGDVDNLSDPLPDCKKCKYMHDQT